MKNGDNVMYPLSPQQRRLGALSAVRDCTTQIVIEYRTAMPVEGIRVGLKQALQRHAALRAYPTGRSADGLCGQSFWERPVVRWREVAFDESDEQRAWGKVIELANDDARVPFDDAAALHCTHVSAKRGRWVIITSPAWRADATSLTVIVRELAEPAREERTPYLSFVAWQNKLAQADGSTAAEREERPVLLPLQRSVDATAPYCAERLIRELPQALVRQLMAIANDMEIARAFFSAAWCALISRLTGESHPCIAFESSGRVYAELAHSIGLIASLATEPVACYSDELFSKIWDGERERWELRDRRAYPPHDRAPVPQYTFAFREWPEPAYGAASAVQVLYLAARLEPCVAGLDILCGNLSARATLHYDGRALTSEDAAHILERYETLLTAAMRNAAQPIDALPILGSRERQEVLGESIAEWPRAAPVLEAFRAHLRERPLAEAAGDERERATFFELNRRADAIAAALRQRGVTRQSRVGVFAYPSVAALASALGIWKIGAVYVPLDPKAPAARIRAIMQDSGIQTVLASRSALPEAVDPHVVVQFDDLDLGGSAEPLHSDARDAAYIVYTSGSTGKPKGVIIEHGSLAAYLLALSKRLDAERGWRFLCVSPLATDLGHTTLFLAPYIGGTLVVAPRDSLLDGDALGAIVTAQRIDCAKFTPTHLAAVLDCAHPERLLPRRALILGGETPGQPLLDRLWSLGAKNVWAHYGPTEATVGVAAGPLKSESARGAIGTPLCGVHAYIVDEKMQLLPLGMVGELCIGGPQVAREYLNDAPATERAFRPDPFARQGHKLYRTGDRVRRLRDGSYQFLGRLDRQCKIRGYRVELDEVEAALAGLIGVARAVVFPDPENAHDSLVAYVVPEARFVATELAAFSAERIAEWRDVFDDAYCSQGDHDSEETAGWESSYTGMPMAAAEIYEQVDALVRRVRNLPCNRILEIGCGNGALLARLAPYAREYTGTDISLESLRHVRTLVDRITLATNVRLLHRSAEDVADFEPGSFDVALLNSVIQYFPAIEYLETVLRRVVPLVKPGGRIIVGDVRNLRLAETFSFSVQLARASTGESTTRLQRLARTALDRERELIPDPSVFHKIAARIAGIADVAIELKHGRYRNELTKFRYDVELTVGDRQDKDGVALRSLPWEQVGSLASLRSILEKGEECIVTAVPNARVAGDVAALRAAERGVITSVPELRAWAEQVEERAVDPEGVRALASSVGYCAALTWSSASHDDAFDAILTRPDSLVCAGSAARALRGARKPSYPTAIEPITERLERSLVPRLRSELAALLPEYLVPSRFLVLRELPLGENGKLDQARLPRPKLIRADLDSRFVAPRTPIEEQIGSIFADVLQLDRVGIHDDFFELGGHSLIATQAVARLRRAFAVELPIRTFFDHPATIASVAAVVETLTRTAPHAIPRCAKSGAAPVSFQQEFFLREPHFAHPVYTIPFAFTLGGSLDEHALERSLDEIVCRHEVLRTTFAEVGGAFVQHVRESEAFTLEREDLGSHPLERREQEAVRMASTFARESLDTRNPLLFRARLLRISSQRHTLLLAVHHAVSDGWSSTVFCRELSALYAAFSAGESSPLPELPIQYRDYATWQRSAAQGGAFERLIRARVDSLDPPVPELVLPVRAPYPPHETYRGSGIQLTFDPAFVSDVREVARREQVSLFVVLLAAFKAVLAGICDETDITVGTPIAGRRSVELEPMLGCFMNFLALRTSLVGNPTVSELLERIQRTAVSAYEHQDAPFIEVLRRCVPVRSTKRPPLFQVMFELGNIPGSRRLQLGDLVLDGLDFDHGTSQFELNLALQEDGTNLRGWLLYRTDLFAEADALRIAAAYDAVLRALSSCPAARLQDLARVTRQVMSGVVPPNGQSVSQLPTAYVSS